MILGLYEEVRRIEPASSRVETGRARSYIVLGMYCSFCTFNPFLHIYLENLGIWTLQHHQKVFSSLAKVKRQHRSRIFYPGEPMLTCGREGSMYGKTQQICSL
jgi:hypothetical protein